VKNYIKQNHVLFVNLKQIFIYLVEIIYHIGYYKDR